MHRQVVNEEVQVTKRPPARPLTGTTVIDAVTHLLTLRGGQLTWAVLNGFKILENRSYRLNGWYALHTGVTMGSLPSQQPLLDGLPGLPLETELPHSAIVGAIKVHTAATRTVATPAPDTAGGGR